jgi:ATP-dependent Clp protease ATP-binding subunit ClpC
LQGRRIVDLNLASLVAQTRKIGNFQEVIRGCVNEARRAKEIILVISTLPRLAKASGGDPAMDVLQAALNRGEIQCIGAVTPEEYRAFIANDTALGRQFRPIQIRPTSKSETVAILSAHRPGLESFHRVQIRDTALEAAVELSEFYLMEGCLPGKAIHLLDETCAFVRLKHIPQLPSLTELESQLEQVQQEKEAAVAEADFTKAANLRDQAEHLKKQREDLVRQAEEKARDVVGTVDKEAVAEVVDKNTGTPIPRSW